jgi:pyruvate dehydrogenase E2 component (dihydrolipoamide acetyltransferase)
MAAVGNARDVTVPDIGDFVDVPVIEILVEAGQHVAAEDPLVVLESDKATMEVPAPFAGVVADVKVKLGDRVSEGATLLVLDVAGENGASASKPPEPPIPRPDRPSAEAGAPRSVESAIAAEVQSGEHAPPPPQPPAATPGEVPVYASPGVRRLARERGIDLATVQGSGRKGRITKEDLERGGAPAPAPAAAGPAPPAGEGERVALTRIQQLSRDAVARSWQTVPHVTQNEDADITELEAFRKQLNAEQSDVKVTMVALLLKACSATLDAFPRFASSLDGDELVIKRERHLGFAADTPNGLVVPVIRDVDQKGLFELAAELTELSGKARAGKLGPKDISGAVFTISSLGGIGGTAFTPIVNLPQVAILGVVRSAMKPVWNGSEFEPRLMLPLSLSYDHRVIDGAAAARFCVHLAGVLKDLRRVLL